ncbi:MAG: MerR family transcriptional regulator [Thermodesulfobacteriota bacterium]
MNQNDHKEIFYTIADLAREFDVSKRAIRFYEEKNLISPGRTKGNYRLYSRRDRSRLRLILRGKRFGYTLDEISEIIGFNNVDTEEKDQIRKAIEFGKKKIDDIRERINELQLLEQEMLGLGKTLKRRLAELEKK